MITQAKRATTGILLAGCILLGIAFTPMPAKAAAVEAGPAHALAVIDAIEKQADISERTVIEMAEDGTITQKELPPINITDSITVPTNLPVEIVREILPETLKPYAEHFCKGEEEHGVNMLFVAAIAKQETSSGTTGVGRSKNNLFGVKGGSGFKYFENFGESIDNQFRMLDEKYIQRGRDTIGSIASIYCVPPEHWANAVRGNFYNYIDKAESQL